MFVIFPKLSCKCDARNGRGFGVKSSLLLLYCFYAIECTYFYPISCFVVAHCKHFNPQHITTIANFKWLYMQTIFYSSLQPHSWGVYVYDYDRFVQWWQTTTDEKGPQGKHVCCNVLFYFRPCCLTGFKSPNPRCQRPLRVTHLKDL